MRKWVKDNDMTDFTSMLADTADKLLQMVLIVITKRS